MILNSFSNCSMTPASGVIVQNIGRALHLNRDDSTKVARIIVPVFLEPSATSLCPARTGTSSATPDQSGAPDGSQSC
ncbi:hypothetical protein AB0K74_49160, partial [Streptomyces sp. NPDC056159]|uniref:hypothetical protein n=1 Tax=Streptomyces sp. NPDC056159 TaxID=3155537 RepID=UPI00342ED087